MCNIYSFRFCYKKFFGYLLTTYLGPKPHEVIDFVSFIHPYASRVWNSSWHVVCA